MAWLKKQMLKVIEWSNSSLDILVYKFPMEDRFEIMNNSKIVVRESQAAIFVNEGQIADVFTAGTWTLETANIPILTKLRSWKYAWETPIKCDVYFVNLKQFTSNKWGTANPIMLRDKDFGMIRVSGHGEYTFHIANPSIFMRECSGTMHSFDTWAIQEHLKSIVISELSDMIGECEIPALDLAANYLELGTATRDHASANFKRLGLDIDQILIRNLKLPEAVEKAMDQRTTLGVFGGKMSELAQYESIQAMRDSAKNPGVGGMFASAGLGLGVGARMGGQFANSMDSIESSDKKTQCTKCSASMRSDAKFCPECGEKNIGVGKIACPKCGASASATAKFCPECGDALVLACAKCGATIKPNAKFCPDCGAKIK